MARISFAMLIIQSLHVQPLRYIFFEFTKILPDAPPAVPRCLICSIRIAIWSVRIWSRGISLWSGWIAPSCRVRTMMASLSSPLLLTLPYSSVLEVYNNINITSSLYIPSISFTISSCRAKFFSVFDKQDRILWRSGIRMCTIVVKAFPLQNFEDAKLETFRGVTCYAGFYRVINHTCCADGRVV